MKPVKISILILVILTISVYANSIYIGHTTKTIAEKVDKIDTENTENAAESFNELFDEFKRFQLKETFDFTFQAKMAGAQKIKDAPPRGGVFFDCQNLTRLQPAGFAHTVHRATSRVQSIE